MTKKPSKSKSVVDSRLTEAALLNEPGVKEAIQKLARRGASRDELLLLARSIPGANKEAEQLVAGINERRLRALPDRINELSREIERTNESPFLNPGRKGNYLASNRAAYSELGSVRASEWVEADANDFLAIPGLLRRYAGYLRMALDCFHPKGRGCSVTPRNYFRMQRLLTLRLLRVVRDTTGKPRYSDVATLLEAAYRISGEYKVIGAEDLKKLEKNADPDLRLIVRFLFDS